MANPSTNAYRNIDAQGAQLREDLLDEILILSNYETPFVGGLKRGSTPTATLHEYNTYELARETSTGALVEGQDTDYPALTTPGRASNWVQEVEQAYKITQKHKDSNSTYGDPVAFYQTDARRKWGLKMEYSAIHATGHSGNASIPTVMKGLKTLISTNNTNVSGQTVTETTFNDYLELVDGQNISSRPMEVYTRMKVKRAISAFTGGTTKFTDADDRRLVNAIDVYESDVAGPIKLFAHPDLRTENTLIAIQPDAFRLAVMHEPEDMDRPASGAYEAGAIYGSGTIEALQEKAGVVVTNYVPSL